jgi:hypothetical protein
MTITLDRDLTVEYSQAPADRGPWQAVLDDPAWVAGEKSNPNGNPWHGEHGYFAGPGSSTGGSARPPKPGTVPLPPGAVRVYHYTKDKATLDSIRKEGLLQGKAVGASYGEPNAVWASFEKPGNDRYYVEIAVSPDEVDVGGPSWQGGDVAKWTEQAAAIGQNITVHGDVPPSRILTYNEPWMHTYDYLVENDRAGVIAGEYDYAITIDANHAEAIAHIKAEGQKSNPEGNPWHDPETGQFSGPEGASTPARTVEDMPGALGDMFAGRPEGTSGSVESRFSPWVAGTVGTKSVRFSKRTVLSPDEQVAAVNLINEELAKWPRDVVDHVMFRVDIETVMGDSAGRMNVEVAEVSGDGVIEISEEAFMSGGALQGTYLGKLPEGVENARWVVDHEMAHAAFWRSALERFPVGTREVTNTYRRDIVNSYLKTELSRFPGAARECMDVSRYASRVAGEEAVAEGVALYQTTGRVPGPASAAMFVDMGIAK